MRYSEVFIRYDDRLLIVFKGNLLKTEFLMFNLPNSIILIEYNKTMKVSHKNTKLRCKQRTSYKIKS